MAEGSIESEEEFNEQFVLDEDMDDLSLDDDALFADLDNEIRLDGEQPAAAAEAGGEEPAALAEDLGDLDLNLDASAAESSPADDELGDLDLEAPAEDAPAGEDSADLGDLSLDAPAVAEPAGGDGLDDLLSGSAGDGLDDLLGDSAGDGLDDLIPDEPAAAAPEGSDDLDDLIPDEPAAAAPAGGDDLDDLLGDAGDGGLDDLIPDEPAAAAPEGSDDLDDLLGDAGDGGLEDLSLDEPAAAPEGGDDLDDLLGDAGGGGLDDLSLDEPAAAAPEGSDDDLDDLLGDAGDGGLEDLSLDEPAAAAPEGGDDLDDLSLDLDGEDMASVDLAVEASGAEAAAEEADDLDDLLGTVDADAVLDDILADAPGEEDVAGDAAAPFGDDLTIDDITLDDGGEEELSLDDGGMGDELTLETDEDTENGGPEVNIEELGDDILEIPPIEDGDPARAVVADLSLDGVDDLDLDSLETAEADEPLDFEDMGEPELEAGGMDFEIAPDVSELDAQLDALDASVLEDDGMDYDEDEELPIEFTSDELMDMGLSEPPTGEVTVEPNEHHYTAIEDVELGEGDLLELDMDSLEPVGGEDLFANVGAVSDADLLEVPLGAPQGRAPAGAPQAPVSHAQPLPAGGISPEVLLAIPHQVNVELGTISLKGKDIMELNYGSVVPLDRTVGEPVNLVLEGKAIAQGEIVLINGKNLGVRIVAVSK